jgi:hypothetical protein
MANNYDENGKFIPYHTYKINWKLNYFSPFRNEWVLMEEGRSFVTKTRSPEAARGMFFYEKSEREGRNTKFEIVSIEYVGESSYGGERYRDGWYPGWG